MIVTGRELIMKNEATHLTHITRAAGHPTRTLRSQAFTRAHRRSLERSSPCRQARAVRLRSLVTVPSGPNLT